MEKILILCITFSCFPCSYVVFWIALFGHQGCMSKIPHPTESIGLTDLMGLDRWVEICFSPVTSCVLCLQKKISFQLLPGFYTCFAIVFLLCCLYCEFQRLMLYRINILSGNEIVSRIHTPFSLNPEFKNEGLVKLQIFSTELEVSVWWMYLVFLPHLQLAFQLQTSCWFRTSVSAVQQFFFLKRYSIGFQSWYHFFVRTDLLVTCAECIEL